MNAVEQLRKGNELIERGKSKGRDVRVLEERVNKLQNFLQAEFEQFKLSEFENRNIAVLIRSELLGADIWFCSDREMVVQVERDAPGAVCYTAAELKHLISLNPGPKDLVRINDAKTVFAGSSIKEEESKDD